MNVDDFLFMGETKVMGYGESDSSGAWIKLQIEADDLPKFRGRKGECCETTLRIIDHMTGVTTDTSGDGDKDKPKKGGLAQRLHKSGYFYNPKLWSCIEDSGHYSQKQHKSWLETLPCYSQHNGKANWNEFTKPLVTTDKLHAGLDMPCPYTGDTDRRIVHHCRDASNAGTSIKPPDWWGIPTCDYHHNMCHNALVTEDFNNSMIEYSAGLTAHRMKEVMKGVCDIESLSDLTDDMLHQFEIEIGMRSVE